MLAARGDNDRDAKNAAHALGHLGDVRGLSELLAAYAEGYEPRVVAQAIRALGPVALGPLIALIEAHPEIAERKAALSVLTELPDQDLAAALIERLEQKSQDPAFPDVASLYLKLAAVHPDCRRAVAKAILGLLPASEEQRPLGKVAKKALN
jgi:HEAT repeat protein